MMRLIPSISNRKFIHHGRIFLEVALEDGITLCIQHKGKTWGIEPAAYGGKSDVSSSNYISYMGLTGDLFACSIWRNST